MDQSKKEKTIYWKKNK